VRRIGLNSCPYCGKSQELYSSRPQSWHDEVCLFFFLQVVRCHCCMRRHYRPLFLPPVPIWSEKTVVETIGSEEKQERRA
jgi:hypothetical protein